METRSRGVLDTPHARGMTPVREERSDEAIHSYFAATWIASRSLSSGAHSRDPLARNDGLNTRHIPNRRRPA